MQRLFQSKWRSLREGWTARKGVESVLCAWCVQELTNLTAFLSPTTDLLWHWASHRSCWAVRSLLTANGTTEVVWNSSVCSWALIFFLLMKGVGAWCCYQDGRDWVMVFSLCCQVQPGDSNVPQVSKGTVGSTVWLPVDGEVVSQISLVCKLWAVSFNLLFMVLQKASVSWLQRQCWWTRRGWRCLPQNSRVTPACFAGCLVTVLEIRAPRNAIYSPHSKWKKITTSTLN